VRKSTGDNDEFLTWKHWDVSKYIGQSGHIEIVDSSNVVWGHLHVDHILQSDVIVDKVNTGQLDQGMDFYAPQSYSDIPAADGRRIWLAWMNNWNYANSVPTSPWRGVMTIPREVRLETHNGQLKLVQSPVEELYRLHKNEVSFTNKNLSTINDALNIGGSNNLLNNSSFKQFELKAKIAVTDQKGFSLKFKKRGMQNTEYIFDFENKQIIFNRSRSGGLTWYQDFRFTQTAPLIVENGYFDLHLFVDNCSAELFTANGQIVMTNQIFPDSTSNRIELNSLRDDFIFQKFQVWRLDKNASIINPVIVNEPIFQVYPNPIINSNGMTIKIKDDKVNSLMFSLFDATGKLIYQFQPSSNSMILPRNKFGNCVGSFILSATDGISSQSQKLLVTGY
jgi:sucrose-6-phosphate hydrolase SacC (GH32 family)